MWSHIASALILTVVIAQALTTPFDFQILQPPALNLTNPTLSTGIWPETPFKADLPESGSYIVIESIVTRQRHDSDFDEDVCDSLQNIIWKRFKKKGSAEAFVRSFNEVDGHVSFTLWPATAPGVLGKGVLAVLRELWFLTSENGAATVFAKYYPKGVEAAELGLLLN